MPPASHGTVTAFTADDERRMLDTIEAWLERDVRPRVLELEHADAYPGEMVEQMKAFGLFGATIAPGHGGLGLSASTYARIVTLISEDWIALPGAFNTHLIMANLVERFGTEAQKRDFLPRFATGELRGGLALTEADGGTDLQATRTRAVRDGDHYVINGAKTWITNGIEGSCFALLVKTDPKAEPRHRGMSLFLAEKGPGFRIGRKLEKLGYHGSDTAELFFEDYRVPEGRLIGGAEGQGFAQAMVGLELGRINVAARSVGLANAALKDSIRYAQLRKTFGKRIGEHQAIQLKLAEMATRCEAARLLTASGCDVEAGMAKYFASEAALQNAQEALRIHAAAFEAPRRWLKANGHLLMLKPASSTDRYQQNGLKRWRSPSRRQRRPTLPERRECAAKMPTFSLENSPGAGGR